MNLEQTLSIKKHALDLGFFACGVAKAEVLNDDKIHYENYLQRGDYGEMDYLTNYFDKRFNPALVLENTKSVIVVLWDYSNYESKETSEGKFAKYACGEDYHVVIKSKLLQLEDEIRNYFPQANMRSFVDASPVLEKTWAAKAGLGFRGKNTLLINPTIGSYCNIGVILIDQELTYDTPLETTCGTCSRCLQSCPTGALEHPYQLNARKCISYYNAEKKRAETFDLQGWAKGCDECQLCCSYNKPK
ncbi:MAG: tRNA epoxyqueuosine(34) reductase QueG [Bacteroidales bacterium]|jgi:epoxyqueuosine reductase|nr:tRNA epoxyqueuosine(34) reductase QueG [Bacteroidales bacterium]